MKAIITGGAGFIGSALARHMAGEMGDDVVVVDALTYAGSREALAPVEGLAGFRFVHADIRDLEAMRALVAEVRPDVILHLAAESHVDRSIDGPAGFRFQHISTDEVYGSLGPEGAFTETTPYAPNSPYSASKAASDHLVRAWHHTYGLPIVTTNCSNNYGPYHFPEKLIPLTIINALEGRPLPVYGTGENVRDWLYVEDHARALRLVAEKGRTGEVYNIGGEAELRNIDVVRAICALVDELAPGERPREELIAFVTDRPGHDARYAMDISKIRAELGWTPRESFATGLRRTVEWFLANRPFWEAIRARRYSGERLGLARREAG